MKTRAGKVVGLSAAATAIALSMGVTVTAHGEPGPEPTPTTTAATTTTATSTVEVPNPEGPGCDAYKKQVPTGSGSFSGMATESLTEAVANNPMLTTLNAAISGQLNPAVNLVGTLNGGEYILFAPIDDAFAQLAPGQLDALKADPTALSNLLHYHIVLGVLYPEDVHGKLTTLQGKQVTVTGKGGDIKVDDTAKVVCGGITTANGVIYMIDTVLDPANSIASTTTPTSSTTTSTETST
ncbi:MAG TPA: fasciclin domain-containing protein, partial [Mycobacterium sp.]|nr:fasciclin domain-containing protein [Mycobacterium sp.]